MLDVVVRSAREEDAPALARIYAPNVEHTAISFEETPPSGADFERRLASVQQHGPWLVCEIGGSVAGYAYLSRHHERAAYRWSADSAVYVGAEYRRRRVGRALYTALFTLAKLQGYCAVHAGVTLPNAASVGLHEAFGFRPVAVYPAVGYKFGRWHDVGWWQLELRERSGPPPALKSPAELEAEKPAEWLAAVAAGTRVLQGAH